MTYNIFKNLPNDILYICIAFSFVAYPLYSAFYCHPIPYQFMRDFLNLTTGMKKDLPFSWKALHLLMHYSALMISFLL